MQKDDPEQDTPISEASKDPKSSVEPETQVGTLEGPGRGGPRFGPVGGDSGQVRDQLEPGRLPVVQPPMVLPEDWEPATEWPERDEWELPSLYGEDVVVALVRDPWWVFVYWEIAEATRLACLERVPEDSDYVLRLREAQGAKRLLAQTRVPEIEAGDWYVQVSAPRLRIQAELGYLSQDGVFESVFESEPVPVPSYSPAPTVEEPGQPVVEISPRQGVDPEPEPAVEIPVQPSPRPEPEKSLPLERSQEIYEFAGGKELSEPRQWKRRMRPILWERRPARGGWRAVRGDGSGSGMGLEEWFMPPEYEWGEVPVDEEGAAPGERGPLGLRPSPSSRPSSPVRPIPGRPSSSSFAPEED